MAGVELLQFAYSHYNEKARWGLDWKGVEHRRTCYLPGPHGPMIRRLTGETTVPVVRFGDQVVAGSAQILAELERRHPDPPLVPEDPGAAKLALDVERHFDEVVGPLVRRSLFAVLVGELGYTATLFAAHHGPIGRGLYRATLPLVRPLMKASMGIVDAESIVEADRGVATALDRVARDTERTGYLVGDTFTVADLTAAALLAPAADPPGSPMAKPEPRPEAVEQWLARWRTHPGVAWVAEIYRRHRPADSPGGVRPGR